MKHYKLFSISILLALLGVVFTTGCKSGSGLQTASFIHSSKNFSFDYPANWKVTQDTNRLDAFISGEEGLEGGILYLSLPQAVDMGDIFNRFKAQFMMSVKNFNQEEEKDVTVGSTQLPAKELLFSGIDKEKNIESKGMFTLVAVDSTQYIVLVFSTPVDKFDSYKDGFELIKSSFKVNQ